MKRYNLAGYADTAGPWIDVVCILAVIMGGGWRLRGGPADGVVLCDLPPADWTLDWWLP